MTFTFTSEQLEEKCNKRGQGYRFKIMEASKYIDGKFEINYDDFKKIEEEFKLPSRLEMAKNLVQAAKEAVQNGLDVRSGDEVQKIMEICILCPKYIESGPRCGFCGCFLKAKTQLKSWHCPLKKW